MGQTLASRPPTSLPSADAPPPSSDTRRQPSASVKSARASAKARLKAEGARKHNVPEAEVIVAEDRGKKGAANNKEYEE